MNEWVQVSPQVGPGLSLRAGQGRLCLTSASLRAVLAEPAPTPVRCLDLCSAPLGPALPLMSPCWAHAHVGDVPWHCTLALSSAQRLWGLAIEDAA